MQSDQPIMHAEQSESKDGAAAPTMSKSQRERQRKAAARQARARALLDRSQSLLPAGQQHGRWGVALSNPSDPASRCVVAWDDLDEGTEILVEGGAGWAVRAVLKEVVCAHCCATFNSKTTRDAKNDGEKVACDDCKATFYCSRSCRSRDLSLHRFICPLVSKVSTGGDGSSVVERISRVGDTEEDLLRLVIALVGRYFLERSQERDSKQKDGATVNSASAHSDHSTTDPTLSVVTPVTVAGWEHVQDLVAHEDLAEVSWMRVVTKSMKMLLEEYTELGAVPTTSADAVYNASANRSPNSSAPSPPPFAGLPLPSLATLTSLCCRINNNSHAISDLVPGTNRVLGIGLFPATALLNHACYPNCIFVGSQGASMRVRTLRKVKRGEELTVPYIDLYMPRRDRQRELWKDRHFLCKCIRCQLEERGQIDVSNTNSSSSSSSDSFTPSVTSLSSSLLPRGTPPSTTPDISSSQLRKWLQVGSVYCPACKERMTGNKAVDESLPVDEKDDNKAVNKKKKKKNKNKQTEASNQQQNHVPTSSSSPSTDATAAAAGPSSDDSSNPHQESACSCTPSSTCSFHESCGLLIWRGSAEEVKDELKALQLQASVAASTPNASNQSKSNSTSTEGDDLMRKVQTSKVWVCNSPHCQAKFSLQQIDAILSPAHDLLGRASRAKQQASAAIGTRDGTVKLHEYAQLLSQVVDVCSGTAENESSMEGHAKGHAAIVPPLHMLMMLSWVPSFNVSRALLANSPRADLMTAQNSSPILLAKRVVESMSNVFPPNVPEVADFLVSLAETIDRKAACTEREMKKCQQEIERETGRLKAAESSGSGSDDAKTKQSASKQIESAQSLRQLLLAQDPIDRLRKEAMEVRERAIKMLQISCGSDHPRTMAMQKQSQQTSV